MTHFGHDSLHGFLLCPISSVAASPCRCLWCVPGALSSSSEQLCLSALVPTEVTSQGPLLSGSHIINFFCCLKNTQLSQGQLACSIHSTALQSSCREFPSGNLFKGPQSRSHGGAPESGDTMSYLQLRSEGESGLWLVQNLVLFQEDLVLWKSTLLHPGIDTTRTHGAKGPNPQVLLCLPPWGASKLPQLQTCSREWYKLSLTKRSRITFVGGMYFMSLVLPLPSSSLEGC